MFDVLVWSVLSYGVEIWGWNFEDKLRRGEGSKIAQACLREILGRERRGNVGYSKSEKEREETRVHNGM